MFVNQGCCKGVSHTLWLSGSPCRKKNVLPEVWEREPVKEIQSFGSRIVPVGLPEGQGV